MLCARAGSNTEFLYIGFRFPHPWNSVQVMGPMGKCRPLKRWSVSNTTQGCVVDAHFVAPVETVRSSFGSASVKTAIRESSTEIGLGKSSKFGMFVR